MSFEFLVNPRQPQIVGIYLTEQARTLPGRNSPELILEAVQGALDDAGLKRDDVDGMAVQWESPGGSPMDPATNWASLFRQPLAFTNSDPLDQAGARGVAKAAAAVESGLCDVAVVGGGRAGPLFEDESMVGAKMGLEFTDPYGATVMAHFGLVMQRYLHEHNPDREKLAEVAAIIRNHGHVNPEAVMYEAGPYTADDILDSPLIASPLHRLECCLVNEGGCALVITTRERAKDLNKPAVSVLGSGMQIHRGNYTLPPTESEMSIGTVARDRALGHAGLSIEDIDYFSLYDACSFEVVRQYEMLGLCAAGEGVDFATEPGRLDAGGKTPTNLDGGLLSHSWVGSAQLTMKVIEAVRQIRGECGNRQAPDVETAMVTNAGSAAHHIEMLVLGEN